MPHFADLRTGPFKVDLNMNWFNMEMEKRDKYITYLPENDEKMRDYNEKVFAEWMEAAMYEFMRCASEGKPPRRCKEQIGLFDYLEQEVEEYVKIDPKAVRVNSREESIDDYESPNVFPYKKCVECGERKSCGSYTMDKQWNCENCYDESVNND